MIILVAEATILAFSILGSSFSLCWLCEPLLESRVMSKLSLGAFPFVVESESGVRVL